MTAAVFFYNRSAGRYPLSAKRLQALLQQLKRHGIEAEPAAAAPGCQTASHLDLSGKQLLIIYGGDGTIHHAIQEAVKWDIPIGLLPAGTANVLARELGIPRNPERALEILVRQKLRRISLGYAQGRYFHLMAGIGLDGFIINQVPGPLKKAFGVASFWITGVLAFWKYPVRPFEIRTDAELHQATFAVIGNASRYGGSLSITPQANIYESHLDVCLFTAKNRLPFLYYLAGVLKGRHLDYPGVIYRKMYQLEVTGEESILVQMDGEVVGHLPMSFSSFQPGLQVIVP
ncbi:MAG: diacylglycerol/lipid kinase family protein [Acidobacteriota bacterium]